MLATLQNQIRLPTVLDYLKIHLNKVLGIDIAGQLETQRKQELAMKAMSALDKDTAMANEADDDDNDWSVSVVNVTQTPTAEEKAEQLLEAQLQSFFVEKMAVYLAKLTQHDSTLAGKRPAVLSVGCIGVALQMCETLKKKCLVDEQVGRRIIEVSRLAQSDIIETSQSILHLAQNFGQELPGLSNLNSRDFSIITQML